MAIIEFQKVGKVLPADVKGRRPVLLREITFGVAAGVCHGFVGANGAGKSSSIRVAIGAMRPTSGTASSRASPSSCRRGSMGSISRPSWRR